MEILALSAPLFVVALVFQLVTCLLSPRKGAKWLPAIFFVLIMGVYTLSVTGILPEHITISRGSTGYGVVDLIENMRAAANLSTAHMGLCIAAAFLSGMLLGWGLSVLLQRRKSK